jgi:hypothetical protein
VSYHVQIFRREVEAAFAMAKDPAFFEKPAALPPLTEENVASLREPLELVGFTKGKSDGRGQHFTHPDWSADAVLTPSALYLSASSDGIFEIGMMASELAGEDLAKFDPQLGTWE